MLTTRSQRAFTIVELLVAISITVLLLTLIFQLFTNTRQAVSAGIKAGEMLVESEAIGNQIRRDAEAMLPPSYDTDEDAGFLVIVQREIPGQIRRAGQPPLTRDIRSDQLIFIRGGDPNREDDDLHALTPEHAQTLASSITANHARVWYGHAMRTNTDGTLPPDATLDASQGPNQYANAWVLGRQALLLTDGMASPTIHAQNAEWDAVVDNADTGGIIGSPQIFHGLTDVANQELRNDDPAGVLDTIEGTYPDAVYPFAIPENRPWVNPDPDTEYFKPWRVAQMHTHLTGKVSDFIVEFAGDYTTPPDGEIDKDADGNIKWYSHFHNEPADADDDPLVGNEPGPVTYEPPNSFENNSTANQNDAYYVTNNLPAEYDDIADAVFVFRHDDATAPNAGAGENSKWPYLIRIRYRLHDAQGHVGGYTEEGERTYGRWFEHVIRVQRP